MSEQAEPFLPLSLDVVKARIFYLACDVEPVSPPAAMLLRAVADAIDEGESGGNSHPITDSNGAFSALFPHASKARPVGSRDHDPEPSPERRFGVVVSQSGNKR